MIFIILIAIGIIGIAGLLWLSEGNLRTAESPVAPGREWYAIPSDVFETSLAVAIKKRFRLLIKDLLLFLIKVYRRISREIRIKEMVKAKVREFLYEHDRSLTRGPSEFISSVKKRTRKSAPVIAPDDTDIQS